MGQGDEHAERIGWDQGCDQGWDQVQDQGQCSGQGRSGSYELEESMDLL